MCRSVLGPTLTNGLIELFCRRGCDPFACDLCGNMDDYPDTWPISHDGGGELYILFGEQKGISTRINENNRLFLRVTSCMATGSNRSWAATTFHGPCHNA